MKEWISTCGRIQLFLGDCLDVLPRVSADAVVTDPPYALTEPRSGGDGCGQAFAARSDEMKARRRGGFMGKAWDSELPSLDHWQAVYDSLPDSAYALIFGGTRTYHRLACAVEDAGWQIRDCLMWLYGSGFPKGKGCLKPAYEPVLLARKPGKVKPLQIDECRVATDGTENFNRPASYNGKHPGWDRPWMHDPEALAKRQAKNDEIAELANTLGRWPANLLHDGSDEVMEAFAVAGESKSTGGRIGNASGAYSALGSTGWNGNHCAGDPGFGDYGTPARFFYCAKASRKERGEGNAHPTVKPLALMAHLCQLVAPPDSVVLDPFTGSGTTALACIQTGRRFIGIEREPKYFEIAQKRIEAALKDDPLFSEVG